MNSFKKNLLLLLCSVVVSWSFAQFQDSFTDGNFTTNPSWEGDVEKFLVNDNQQLQLQDNDATGAAQLYTNFNMQGETTWDFYVQMDFSPSSSNFCKVYLQSDQPDLTGNLNGYFLKIGGISGADDAVELFRQDGAAETLLLRGTIGAVSGNPVQVRIRVIRSEAGEWQLFADYAGGDNLMLEGSAMDNTYALGNIFGVSCTYTSSRSDLFFFDDFAISTQTDMESPRPTAVNVINATILEIQFNEALADNPTISDLDNYELTPTLPISEATLLTPTSIQLILSTELINLETYTLSIQNIEDTFGNAITNESIEFTVTIAATAAAQEVLITEVMADPTPAVGLPEAEFIELYNNTNKVFQLENWTISSGTTPQSLPNFQLLPEQYLIICDDSDVEDFESFGTVVAVNSFPALTNGGDQIVLKNAMGTTIDSLTYAISWYQDNFKDNGGYSLELINPNQICKGAFNWIASTALEGGTPGQQNAVFENTPDTIAPVVSSFAVLDATTIKIIFDDVMSDAVLAVENYTFSNGITTQSVVSDDFLEVRLTVTPNFEDRTAYQLILTNGIQDCSGNIIEAEPIEFTYFDAAIAAPYDVLINEIMVDPSPSLGLPEAEYIELYNRSDKVIDLQDFLLSDPTREILLPTYLLLPGQYVLFYEQAAADFSTVETAIGLEDFLSFSNSSDEVALISAEGEVIHAIRYSSSWYKNSDKDNGGWSLELISPERACENEGDNWIASNSGIGGTPGNENSVFENIVDTTFNGLVRAFPIDDTQIRLFFDEAVNRTLADDPNRYSIEGLQVEAAITEPLLYQTVRLQFEEAAQTSTLYDVVLSDDFTDCLDNELLTNSTAAFAIPDVIQETDIVINEILFNPESGGSDFLELYNRSEKIVDLSTLIVANRVGAEISEAQLIETPFLLFPNDYIVLTEDRQNILSQYLVERPNLIVETELPAMADKAGTVLIYTTDTGATQVIDEVSYSNTWHNDLLDDENGVSLERINFNAASQDENNWHSAAATVGFATPTAQNSQFMESMEATTQNFELRSESISPNGDGFQDFLQLQYTFNQPNFLATVSILDANGRMVKTLLDAALMDISGSIKWDGVYEDGTKARLGIYIIHIEYFSPDGSANQDQFTFSVVQPE